MGVPRVSSTNTNGLRPGSGKSLYTYTVSVVWWYLAMPRWVSFSEDGFERCLADNFTAETEGRKGSSRDNLLPSKRGYPSGIGTRPTPAKHDDTRAGRPIPSEHQGFGQMDPLAYREWESTSTSSRRGFVIQSSCLQPSSIFYSREKPTHTSNCGVVSASLAGTRR